MDIPAPVRVLALALAALLTFVHGSGAADAVGEPLILGAHVAILAAFLPALVWVAATPDRAGPWLRRSVGLDLREVAQAVGALIHLAFVYLVFGLTILGTAQAASQYLATGQHPVQGSGLEARNIIRGLVFNLLLFVIAAMTWLGLVERRSIGDSLRDLGLRPGDLPAGIAWGLATTLAVLAGLVGMGLGLQAVGYMPENPQADAIADALTPALAILVAVLAGVGEELYFRGFLLPRTNNLVQAGLFGIIHASYLTPFQVILPFLLGLVFGWVRRETSLWAVIVAHAAFNATMLLLSIYADEAQLALSAILG